MIEKVVHHLNPQQMPVIVMDQPLYALAKQIQWSQPEHHGEDNCIIMLGGLHIEMAAFNTLGDWLEGSGRTHAIATADIATSGVADSFTKVTQSLQN